MKIYIGSDHGGFELKEKLKKFLIDNNYIVEDLGCHSLESVDYPDFGFAVAEKVRDDQESRGIVVCSTGIGISIAANKVKNIRCSLVSDLESARLTRQHNDSNVLALGAKIIDHNLALEITNVWLNTAFEGGRHQRRIDKITHYEVKK